MRAPQPFWARAERLAERLFHVEHGANVGPLLHVLCYYGFFLALAVPGAVTWTPSRIALWILLYLTNYSLTVGVLHLHCHRPLFTSARANRVLEILLCFPSLVTATEMLVTHVHHHHHHDNGPQDITTTVGHERGLKALWYWLIYGIRVKAHTIGELFGKNARPAWRSRRVQFLADWIGCAAAALALRVIDAEVAFTLWALPLVVTHFNIGYFAWLTHAPAGVGKVNGSLNTVNNWLGLFIFNQGYHQVHHRFPGIHWTDIPEKLELMHEVDTKYVVPYWVTIQSAWRILAPERFNAPRYGEHWKEHFRRAQAERRLRISWFPYFAWIPERSTASAPPSTV